MLEPTKELSEKIKCQLTDDFYFPELKKLKNKINTSFKKKEEIYLTSIELDEIIKWKLDRQYFRSAKSRMVNTDDVVIPVTRAAFSVKSADREYEISTKISLLSSLKGVATPLASAILAIVQPEKFAIIDSVLWLAIYDEERSTFSAKDYIKFLGFIEKLAAMSKLEVQEAEFALWLHLMRAK